MNIQSKRPQTLLLSATLLLGSEILYHQAHSQSSGLQSIPAATNAPVGATRTHEKSSTNIVKKLADLPILRTNDPFANTFAMLKRAATDNPITSTLSALSGNNGLQLKGSVVDEEGQRLALVEIGSTGVHVVREGDTLSLSGGGRSANVTIINIRRQSVEVEFGNFEDSVIIR